MTQARGEGAGVVSVIKRVLGEFLDLPEEGLDVSAPFMALGLSSSAAMELLGRLEDVLGMELPATALFDYPTTADLAAHLAQLLPENAQPPESIASPPEVRYMRTADVPQRGRKGEEGGAIAAWL